MSTGRSLTISLLDNFGAAIRRLRLLAGWSSLVLFAASRVLGQQATLSLSSGSTTPGSSTTLTVSLSASGAAQPNSLEWTMNYPTGVAGVTVIAGPAASAAGKTISCSYGVLSATCLIWGMNTTVIPDGPVATATLTVLPASTTASVPITISGAIVVEVGGNPVPLSEAAGSITVLPKMTCSPSGGPSLQGQFYSSQCSVTGGIPPFHWQVGAGALPFGISLTDYGTSALIAGTPSVAGSYSYTVSTHDSLSPVPLKATLAYAGMIQSSSPTFNFVGSMPHVAAEENWTTTFTLVNTGVDFAQTRLTLLDDSGGPLAIPLSLPQQPATQSPVTMPVFDWALASNASLISRTSGPTNVPVQVGSAQLAATGSVRGFAIFHSIPTASEAVVPMETRNAGSYVLAFDNTAGVLLGVAVENVSAQTAQIPITIRDDTGAQISTPGATISLAGHGHTSFVLSDPVQGFPVTANRRGTIEFDTPSGGQISVLGIRTTPLGNGNTFTTIPALANVDVGGGSIAHLATGNGWQSTFVLVNMGASAAQANLNFFADDGSPLFLPLEFPQSGNGTASVASSMSRTLAPGAGLWVQSAAPLSNPAPTTGSAQLTTNGNIGGFVIFRYNPNGQEAVVPMETRNANAYILAFDNTAGTATGVAINSVSGQAVSIPVVVRDDMGVQIATDTISLAANGHLAFTLSTDKYPATANIRGTVEFDKPAVAQIGVLGIRVPVTHTFTTLPSLAK